MLLDVLQSLHSTCMWYIAIPSNDVFHAFAQFDVIPCVLHWELFEYAGVVSVVLVFGPVTTYILCIAASVRSVTYFCIVGESVTHSMKKALCVPLSSIPTVSGVVDTT